MKLNAQDSQNTKDIDQLQEMYDYALYLMHEKKDASDLFKGLINECDLNVKKVYLENFRNSILVPQFYLIYGNALREYAKTIREQDDFQDCLDMARDQYELGLEKDDDGYHKEINLEIILLNLFQVSAMGGAEVENISRNSIKDKLKSFDKYQSLKLGLGIQEYSNCIDQEDARMDWNDFALNILQNLELSENDEDNLTRIDGIAQCFLSKANYYAEQSLDETEVCSNTDKALSFLKQGLEWIQKALQQNSEYAQGLATKGEVLIYISDIYAQLQISTESENYYNDALKAFQKCHAVDATVLPDQFFELL